MIAGLLLAADCALAGRAEPLDEPAPTGSNWVNSWVTLRTESQSVPLTRAAWYAFRPSTRAEDLRFT